ncbi:hypothetical protein [Brevibacterium limosum]|uniref:hypothetical protein n=1 Tax=Brevibacterium limosum TaxID=2697565 RepID=UPI0014203336|nr:hypothetical protein [Brevibacterium limosum]
MKITHKDTGWNHPPDAHTQSKQHESSTKGIELTIKTTNEDQHRPAAEAADSQLAKAREALADAQSELQTARQKLADHEALADTAKSKPKNWAHDGAELSATITWYERMVTARASAVAEAEAEAAEAVRVLALAQMQDRAETIGAFSRAEFVRRYAAKLAPIAAEAWAELNTLTDLEREVATIAKGAGIDYSHPRYSVPSGGTGEHVFDGIRLNPAGLTASTVSEALAVPENPRTVSRREQLAAEDRQRREEERQREAEAQAEWERNVPKREAYARFQQAHDAWTAERLRRSRAMQSTAGMGLEPVLSDPTTW